MWRRKHKCFEQAPCPGLLKAQEAQVMSAQALEEVQHLTVQVTEMADELRDFRRENQISLKLMAMLRGEGGEDNGPAIVR